MPARIPSVYSTVKTDNFPLTGIVLNVISGLRVRSIEILVNDRRAGKRNKAISSSSKRDPSVAIDFAILPHKT